MCSNITYRNYRHRFVENIFGITDYLVFHIKTMSSKQGFLNSSIFRLLYFATFNHLNFNKMKCFIRAQWKHRSENTVSALLTVAQLRSHHVSNEASCAELCRTLVHFVRIRRRLDFVISHSAYSRVSFTCEAIIK